MTDSTVNHLQAALSGRYEIERELGRGGMATVYLARDLRLSGEPLHTGATAQAIVARLMTEEPRPLANVRRSVPEHVDDAVQCALEKLPADRFASAKEFADALRGGAVSAGRSQLARSGSPSASTKTTILRWRYAALASGVVGPCSAAPQ